MGFIDFIVNGFILKFLDIAYVHIIPNYGIGILLLTLLVKLIFYPLTRKQFQSMNAMKAIQPKLQALQKKHKSDPKKLQQSMMQLYKDHNVNPLSGCLPMLVQLRIFFAIFHGINSETFQIMTQQVGVYAGFVPFWIDNLVQPDRFFILPALVGASTWWSQKLMAINPQQQKIMAFLPIVMVFICLKMPAGVLLYWASSQIISTIQQIMANKSIDAANGIITVKS